MQFVSNGPDIPNSLIQAHEDEKVVFFCGAGISCQAGLPTFEKLVNEIYDKSRVERTSEEKELSLDTQLNLLAQKIPELEIRRALGEALIPNLSLPGAKDTHRALLELGKSKSSGALRLITTNYDRMFHIVSAEDKKDLKFYSAPLLPIPKVSSWDGLVFLHGLLPDPPNNSSLNQLIVTSSDFGLAYLTERWASRFLTELFKNYEVCFIGYKLSDPVLRYIVDALASDRRHGENTPPTWAFVSCEPSKEAEVEATWKAKGINPILYTVPDSDKKDHSALHNTICKWAATYRDGITSKANIVQTYAPIHPSKSTPQDNFAGRMLWAISDPSGWPVKQFSEFEPLPALEWLLDVFSKKTFSRNDLIQFGIKNISDFDKNFKFSLIQRPTLSSAYSSMQLVSNNRSDTELDPIMKAIGHWLTRHLGDPRLLFWVIENGGTLNPFWRGQIVEKLNDIERNNDKPEAQQQKNSPDHLLITLWHLLLDNKIYCNEYFFNFFSWKNAFRSKGLNRHLKFELLKSLSPKVKVSTSQYVRNHINKENWEKNTTFDLVLADPSISTLLKDFSQDANWKKALPHLLIDIQALLLEALEIMSDLDQADDILDPSWSAMPSIEPHYQNRGFYKWTILVELLRDAWLETLGKDVTLARNIAQNWFNLPYLTFKRLALFAASQNECIRPECWIEWLLNNNAKYLWLSSVKREVMRLLTLQSSYLSSNDKAKLELAILAGPVERGQIGNDYDIWLRLKKMQSSGVALDDNSLKKLDAISSKYPNLSSSNPQEKEEFSFWMSLPGDVDHDIELKKSQEVPKSKELLVKWLRTNNEQDAHYWSSGWRNVCRSEMHECISALVDLAHENIFQPIYWDIAIQTWSEDELLLQSYKFLPETLKALSNNFLVKILQSISHWLFSISKTSIENITPIVELISKLLDAIESATPEDNTTFSLFDAINHPVGVIAESIFNICFELKPSDGDKLPSNLLPLFNKFIISGNTSFRYAKSILAINTIYLYRLDEMWTKEKLLPLLDWKTNGDEAKYVWQGFLWSPRIFQPLLVHIKKSFLETPNHYDKLGECASSFANFLTFAAIEGVEGYETREWSEAIKRLPQSGIDESAKLLPRLLTTNKERHTEYWTNRVIPFWENIWPKELKYYSKSVIESLCLLCIYSDNLFQSALIEVGPYLEPIEKPVFIIEELQNLELCAKFPDDSLCFLGKIIERKHHSIHGLKECLEKIKLAKPELRTASAMRELESCCIY